MSKLKKRKLKTKKIVQKRFKVTGSGKILRRHSHTTHLKEKQSARTKRRKNQEVVVSGTNEKMIKKLLPYWKSLRGS